MLSYGRLTVDFGIVVFAKTRWLFSYGVTFLPDARGRYPEPFGRYPALHTLTSVGRKKLFSMSRNVAAFSCCTKVI